MEKEVYTTTYENEKSYFWYQARADIVENIFARVAESKTVEILNLGCGTGLTSERFSRFGFMVSADMSGDALAFCARNSLDNMTRADAIVLPFKDQCFDCCLALDVIEHIPNDQQALSEINRVLKPGGFLLMTVPAFQWMWSKIYDFDHARRYTKPQISSLLENGGFNPIIFTYYNFFLFPVALLQRYYERITGTEKRPGDFIPHLPPAINKMFYTIFKSEKNLLGRVNFPFGLSILALAQKK
jgi:SAM-dependent methyltransferase